MISTFYLLSAVNFEEFLSEMSQTLGALCALYLMDKQGRLRLLTGSYLGMVS